MLIQVTALSTAWVYGHSLAEIEGSNPAGDMYICLLWVLCVLSGRGFATGRSLVQSFPAECFVSISDLETSTMIRPRSTWAVEPCTKIRPNQICANSSHFYCTVKV